MTDQDRWQQAVEHYSRFFMDLSADCRRDLDLLIDQVTQIKEQMVAIATAAGGETICRNCSGECCLFGKYHFTVLDLLAYQKANCQLVVPAFTSDSHCPYSDKNGCLMPARFRPATCVIFNCELIEERLRAEEKALLAQQEQHLKSLIAKAGKLAGRRLERPLLLSREP